MRYKAKMLLVDKLLETMNKLDLEYLEADLKDIHIVMKKNGKQRAVVNDLGINTKDEVGCSKVENEIKMIEDENIITVCSPMVGVFYEAVSPDSKPFVKKNDKVNKGDVLCIIEAMKLMNEIQCEESGEIVEVCVKNGQIVEYNQPLFMIKV